MRIGTVLSMPDDYTQFARVKEENGTAYTADPSTLPKGAKEGSKLAFKVEIWGNDSGLVYDVEET